MRSAKEISDAVVAVVDRGTFFGVAKRLARDFKRVIYHKPDGEASKTLAQWCRGYNHPDVELCTDFWKIKNEVDVFCVPDCNDSGLQLELESQGFPVWGSKDSVAEEEMRGVWIETAERLGLPMPKTHQIRGITNATLFFNEHEGEEFHVKFSRFRGDVETFKVKERSALRNKLDVLRMKWGPFQDEIMFYIQEPVDTDIEGGADTYFVNGEYPDKIVLGYEKKGESYFATWKDRADMPPEIWEPSEVIAPLLKAYGYCNLISTEIRVAEDKSYLLDPCLRFGSPAGEEELELYENFSEIIYYGARGELVQPEMAAKFCGEAVISYCGDKDGWKSIRIPDEVERWVKLYACGYQDGAYHFPPSQDPEAIGCVVALGDTPEEVLDGLKEVAEAMKDSAVEVNIVPIADLFKEIEKAEDEGIPFTDKEMPEPAAALDS